MESRQLRSAGPIRDDRVDILGVGVSAINVGDAVATIERWISEGNRNYVCITGVHGAMESRRNQRLRRIHNEAGPTACHWCGCRVSWASIARNAFMVPI
jgi:N-acetylglucosaminyldiphosphoundecaprenol N-acetyl-beta-D-mannosaminyltransferase